MSDTDQDASPLEEDTVFEENVEQASEVVEGSLALAEDLGDPGLLGQVHRSRVQHAAIRSREGQAGFVQPPVPVVITGGGNVESGYSLFLDAQHHDYVGAFQGLVE